MKREAHFCDVARCDWPASDACAICSHDYCSVHAGGSLGLAVGARKLTVPGAVGVSDQTTIGAANRSLCAACRLFIDGLSVALFGLGPPMPPIPSLPQPSPRAIFPMLDTMIDALVTDIKTLKAAHALGVRGEDLLKAGGRT